MRLLEWYPFGSSLEGKVNRIWPLNWRRIHQSSFELASHWHLILHNWVTCIEIKKDILNLKWSIKLKVNGLQGYVQCILRSKLACGWIWIIWSYDLNTDSLAANYLCVTCCGYRRRRYQTYASDCEASHKSLSRSLDTAAIQSAMLQTQSPGNRIQIKLSFVQHAIRTLDIYMARMIKIDWKRWQWEEYAKKMACSLQSNYEQRVVSCGWRWLHLRDLSFVSQSSSGRSWHFIYCKCSRCHM